MKTLRNSALLLVAALIVVAGSEIGERLSIPQAHSFIPAAEARVCRPLRPVSFAGVARRTVRRCAVGVYNC